MKTKWLPVLVVIAVLVLGGAGYAVTRGIQAGTRDRAEVSAEKVATTFFEAYFFTNDVGRAWDVGRPGLFEQPTRQAFVDRRQSFLSPRPVPAYKLAMERIGNDFSYTFHTIERDYRVDVSYLDEAGWRVVRFKSGES